MKTLAAVAVLCGTIVVTNAQSTAPLTSVRVAEGQLAGTASPDGVAVAFKGVPFAAPPVGDLRWRAPQAPAPWQGTRQAAAFGAN